MNYLIITLLFISGISEAIHQILLFRYNDSIFSTLNRRFWDSSISWENKWKVIGKEEKFPGSSSIFVWTTDAYHLFRAIDKFSLYGSIVLLLLFPTQHYLQFLLSGIALKMCTFHVYYTYILIKRKKVQ